MSWRESRVVFLGLIGIILLLVGNAIVSDVNTRRLVENEGWVEHTLEVLETLKEVHATVVEAETTQRGFLITGRPAYLEMFQAASKRADELNRRLATLVADNPEQMKRAAALEALVQMRIDRLRDTTIVRQEQGADVANARVGTDDGQRIMDRIHAQVESMQSTENALLARRTAESESSLRIKGVTNVLGTVTGIGAVSLAFLLFQRRLRERARSVEVLRESEERFRSLADSVPGIVWTSLPNGECDYVNQRWSDYTGLPSEEALGLAWASVLHEDDVEDSKKRWMSSMETGEPFECEYRFRSKEGEYRWCLGRALPVRDSQGRIVKWFGTLTDVEDYKRMERAQKDAARNKDEFLAMLGHELRNPLASIFNMVELLERRARVDSSLKWEVEGIGRQIGELMRIVDDLLDASRIGRGKIRIERAPVDLHEVIDQVVELARPLIDARRHELEVDLPEEPLPLYADATRLVQIVSNLLTNAAKYTDPGGRIWLGAERQEQDVVIRVRDNGVGIPGDMLPHVFEMFLQLDASNARSHGGLGIGLSIVRSLVELHGGSVEARSEGPGRGSEFTVRLPLDSRAASRVLEPAKAEPPEPPLRPCKILVVDDNELLAESFARLLRHEGCNVRTAGDGKGAIGLAREFQPEVVFLDVGLPDMDGYEVAESLKHDPNLQKTLLVAVTGYGQPADVRRARGAGFVHHMVKPVQMEDVERVLRKFQASEI